MVEVVLMNEIGSATDVSSVPLYERVMAYQNPSLTTRIAAKLDLSADEALELFADTKKFLYFCATRRGEWQPPTLIDKCWHEFLLYTRDYQNFCDSMFGRFIHHQPDTDKPLKPREVKAEATLLAARGAFGTLSKNWEFPYLTREPKEFKDPDVLTWSSCMCSC